MYLSRVLLDPQQAQTYQLVSSPYRIHAIVEAACESTSHAVQSGITNEARNLWRLDYGTDAPAPLQLYIVSSEMPNCDALNQKTGSYDVQTKSYDVRVESITEGQVWNFRLKANPVRKVRQDKGTTPQEGVVGTLRGHVTLEQQTQWLLSRSEKHGFRILLDADENPQLTVSQRRKERFHRQGAVVTLTTAVYDGFLEVTDAALFREMLCLGIGRAKGFGCGLLTIASTSPEQS